MHHRMTLLGFSLVLTGCGPDIVEVLPACDDISWPLGVEPDISPPMPEFAVECADGWGNSVPTRPALDMAALPASGWITEPHPDGGWVHVLLPVVYPAWNSWLEAEGVDPASLPSAHALVRTEADGSLGWVVPQYSIWMLAFVGEELWALGGHADDEPSLLVFDPASGELLDTRPWDLGPRYNRIAAARDPAGGAWITAIEDREADDLVDQSLYRAVTIDAVELVATRTTDDPQFTPSGGVQALQDGAAAWWTSDGFEVVELDGTVRWAHADGNSAASDADSMLIISAIPTGFGPGQSLRLEKVALADGAIQWTREHQRYVVAEPERCRPGDCALIDFVYPMQRPDGGYLLLGGHAYPSNFCPWQPLVMAVSADGEAEWAHRVETCGRAYRAAFRDDTTLEILGLTGLVAEPAWSGEWTRWLEL
jgi:hypothetical protein